MPKKRIRNKVCKHKAGFEPVDPLPVKYLPDAGVTEIDCFGPMEVVPMRCRRCGAVRT